MVNLSNVYDGIGKDLYLAFSQQFHKFLSLFCSWTPAEVSTPDLVEKPTICTTYLKKPRGERTAQDGRCSAGVQLFHREGSNQDAGRLSDNQLLYPLMGPFFLSLSISVIHQNIAAAAHEEQSQLRKQLLRCLWATRASRVMSWPLLFLFQLFYWAACSKKKAACSQKCIFPFCEIWPAPESLISLSQIRNLSYSQFTLAEN